MKGIEKAVFVLIALAFSGNALAFKYNGYKWSKFPIVWYLDSQEYQQNINRAKIQAALQQAFDTWETAKFDGKCTSVRFKFGGNVNANGPRNDRKSVISFAFSPVYDGAPGSLGKIVIYAQEADIMFPQQINFSVDPKAGQYDLVSVAMLQIGYMLGLANSDVEGATMYKMKIQPGDTSRRALSDDDKQAIVNLYPADCPGTADQTDAYIADIQNTSENAENEAPKFRCSTSFSNSGENGILFLLFMIMAVLFLFRRKKNLNL